ncbi:hypothetical protein G6F16_007084 [Rhizopus arrhizus]|uniref:Blue light receptor n=1 Tax=Rhizopus oryzae TaxID=64495 RepID=A0A9P6XBZ5_RHIOR|nr:hypothetical protein G6F24_005499 [Rhizopus arrhizus]KAG0794751.1 hypothetical protein G6F21_002634 [Rhizopus arrhizus]KAG0813037.1 hypothetical protein G6F20_005881 [Rhizopus arrhizus]KAG0832860.1 hypothetical protein G6F19_006002 [Rhizopus arrhizus]KAG0835002.1 hypothetical protein G6F18_006041 [Rhizopus arrhizus]
MSLFNNELEITNNQPSAILSGVYSNTGFDMVVVYCSPGFEKLTGYCQDEIVGRNCRFLQSPDGQVTGGSRRQHTDNQAVYYLKSQLNQAKEHQASIINYKKGGQPFVNLITVIPLFSSSDGQVEYFVGLQVDLVEQPNSILEKMKNGTYLVNYSQPSYATIPSIKENGENVVDDSVSLLDEYFRELPPAIDFNADILSLLDHSASEISSESQIRKEWNQLVLNQTNDFIHVLSLKGTFLYVSDSSLSILEYQPHELVGKSLNSICHPSDIIPVMREIKEKTTNNNMDNVVSVIFRIRRKHSGYIWIDCRGKLHMDQNKSRKCLILCGREYPTYNLSYSQADIYKEAYWAKLSLSGLYLHVTEVCKEIVGFTADTLLNESIYQYLGNEAITEISSALQYVKETRNSMSVRHSLLNSKGDYVPVLSTFYPGNRDRCIPLFILLQVKPVKDDNNTICCDSHTDSVNIFSELDVTRSTNWQYELHQLQQSNKKLREEIKEYMNTNKRSRKKTKEEGVKICANCQTKDSPEWRKGPSGPKELCNACGLRFAKLEKKNKK